jgi:hypothetical protein
MRLGTEIHQQLGGRIYCTEDEISKQNSVDHMTEAKKNWAESRQLRVGAMVPTEQRRQDLRIAGEGQSGAPPGGGSTQNRS